MPVESTKIAERKTHSLYPKGTRLQSPALWFRYRGAQICSSDTIEDRRHRYADPLLLAQSHQETGRVKMYWYGPIGTQNLRCLLDMVDYEDSRAELMYEHLMAQPVGSYFHDGEDWYLKTDFMDEHDSAPFMWVNLETGKGAHAATLAQRKVGFVSRSSNSNRFMLR